MQVSVQYNSAHEICFIYMLHIYIFMHICYVYALYNWDHKIEDNLLAKNNFPTMFVDMYHK